MARRKVKKKMRKNEKEFEIKKKNRGTYETATDSMF
jgi:hypothetical protein